MTIDLLWWILDVSSVIILTFVVVYFLIGSEL
jgi:hypothetical protein